MLWPAATLILGVVSAYAALPIIAEEQNLMNTVFEDLDLDGNGCISRAEFTHHSRRQRNSHPRNEKLDEVTTVVNNFSKEEVNPDNISPDTADSHFAWTAYTTRTQILSNNLEDRSLASAAPEGRDSEAAPSPSLPVSKLFLNWQNQSFSLKVERTAGVASVSEAGQPHTNASFSSSSVRVPVELLHGSPADSLDREEIAFVIEWADLSSSAGRESQAGTEVDSLQSKLGGREVSRTRQLLNCSEDGDSCGSKILDDDTTCTTTDRLWGGYATVVNRSPGTCCEFCRVNHPETTVSDYWKDLEWCNCYGSCSSVRCVSLACYGHLGGSVVTWKLRLSPPPASPSMPEVPFPPPAMPSPPPIPPAPPLQTCCEATVANISTLNPIHAADQLSQAISTASIQLIFLSTAVSLEQGALPSITRSLNITGQCKSAPCELSGHRTFRIFAVESGGTFVLRALALRFGFSSSNGGALYLAPYSVALLYECTVESSTAGNGGGIYLDANSSLHMAACLLDGNTAQASMGTSGGGAVYGVGSAFLELSNGTHFSNNYAVRNGGSIYLLEESVMEMHNTTVTTSYAEQESGGGITLYYSDARITNCRLSQSRAGSMGGALCCSTRCTLSLADTIVSDNLSGDSGGGLYAHVGAVFMVGPATQVLHNKVNNSGFGGGGIYLYDDSRLHILNSVVQYNQATFGGGICCRESSVVALTKGSLVTDNTARVGGGLYVRRNSRSLISDASMVEYNVAANGGGGIATQDNDILLEVVDFSSVDRNIA
ncbi:hypothetical protein CYMTET_28046, partial [Cymbomonas tetramitiformis]